LTRCRQAVEAAGGKVRPGVAVCLEPRLRGSFTDWQFDRHLRRRLAVWGQVRRAAGDGQRGGGKLSSGGFGFRWGGWCVGGGGGAVLWLATGVVPDHLGRAAREPGRRYRGCRRLGKVQGTPRWWQYEYRCWQGDSGGGAVVSMGRQ